MEPMLHRHDVFHERHPWLAVEIFYCRADVADAADVGLLGGRKYYTQLEYFVVV